MDLVGGTLIVALVGATHIVAFIGCTFIVGPRKGYSHSRPC